MMAAPFKRREIVGGWEHDHQPHQRFSTSTRKVEAMRVVSGNSGYYYDDLFVTNCIIIHDWQLLHKASPTHQQNKKISA